MKIWIDAQLSPSLAAWINRTFGNIESQSIRAVGLRDANDLEIFFEARKQDAIVMTKDDDFLRLIELHGPPPKIILITCGNSSNARMREILSQYLLTALSMLEKEALVEISGE
jgi:predicted nuclease of predicted toxin-antitoxin system